MTLQEPALGSTTDIEEPAHILRIGLGLQPNRENDHIHRNAADKTGQRVLGADHQLAFFRRVDSPVADLGNASTDKVHSFIEQPVIEFLVTFSRRSHVDIEIEDFRPRVLLNKVGEFEGIHAANLGAPTVGVGIARADAMDNAHRCGLLAVAKNYLASSWAGSVDQPFHLEGGIDIRVSAIPAVWIALGRKSLEAGG